ncbi:MAG: bacillithiol biosynthesis cysteine-adding enzyme BshC, partial [Eudoraea sp.]|uniref:bacillithiol biosynthesis cysteine-adding enzyme BshC n=1 Tax=Eudoraea sp. TaxID=1979955 RepID=UPI003C7766EB
MEIASIPFKKTGYFSSLICDYLDEKPSLQGFYNSFPSIDGFKLQLQKKEKSFTKEKRQVLVKALNSQYAELLVSEDTEKNITLLGDNKTFTIVTGHQLNIFTGPLYFLYKIVSTINLSRDLKKAYPSYNFVPIYWMATEDHDFEEINYFNLHGKKFQWNIKASGAVGRLSTNGLNEVYEALVQELGTSLNALELTELFKKSYLEHETLAEATRYLANTLCGNEGLVVVDGDSSELKREFIPFVKEELLNNISQNKVQQTIEELENLSSDYTIQVNPRPINYFYLLDGLRERILEKEGRFYINNTKLEYSKEEFLGILEKYPERFSPNVVKRPLYQEVILPNLSYIGGGGEL